MFIIKKEIKNNKTGKIYTYLQLMETVQTDKGPKPRMLVHIGDFDLSVEEQKILAVIIENKIKGNQILKFTEKLEKIADIAYIKYNNKITGQVQNKPEIQKGKNVEVDLDTTEMTQSRFAGSELVGIEFWNRLKFDEVLQSCGFSQKETDLAKVVILGRLISPGSDLHTHRWVNEQSVLVEYLKTCFSRISKDNIYEIGDMLYLHKGQIERKLRSNVKSLYPYIDKVYLYDLTNTYFEGNKVGSELCKRGKSKENRTDCPLVTLALVVDQEGFPVYSKIYKGNQSEPATLKEVLQEVFSHRQNLQEIFQKPSIIMDRGIATSENLSYLKNEGYSYFVIERKNLVKDYASEFSDLTGFEEYKDKSKQSIFIKKTEDSDSVKVLVFSTGREKKEKAIVNHQEANFLEDSSNLIKSNFKNTIKNIDKINIRIGRLKERYGAIAGKYNFVLITEEKDQQKVKEIKIEKTDKNPLKDDYAGCYVIQTDHKDLTGKEIWDFYMTLTEVESSFRSIKTELGTRPIYHQLDSRIESHLFISVLAYSILKSITYKLNQNNFRKSWKEIREDLLTHMRSTIIQHDKKGTAYSIRITGTPEKKAKEIYDLLEMKTSSHRIIKRIRNSDCRT